MSDESVEYDVENESGDTNSIADSPRDCLVARLYPGEYAQLPDLVAENCFAKKVRTLIITCDRISCSSTNVQNLPELRLRKPLASLYFSALSLRGPRSDGDVQDLVGEQLGGGAPGLPPRSPLHRPLRGHLRVLLGCQVLLRDRLGLNYLEPLVPSNY